MSHARLRPLLLLVGFLASSCGATKTVAIAPPEPGVGAAVPSSSERLNADLAAIFTDPQFDRSYWSVVVRSPNPQQDLYSLNAAKLMIPGSVMKILTAAAAVEQLGWDHQFETKVVSSAPHEAETVRGDVIVVGGGDPGISERSDSPNQLRLLARELHSAGIRRIEGGIIGDDDAFDDSSFGDGWTLDNLPYGYSAGVSALEYNEGSVDLIIRAGAAPGDPVVIQIRPEASGLQVENMLVTAAESAAGSLTLHRWPGSSRVVVRGQIPAKAAPFARTASVDNPTQFFAAAFRQALLAEGIQVVGDAVDIDDLESKPNQSDARLLAVHRSLPLRELIGSMMRVSQNQYAEMLLKAIGGRTRVREILRGWNVPDDSYIIADGSGLSRYNYVSADTLVRILEVLAEHPKHASFVHVLPVAGREGTLARRLAGTPAEGKVRAKTGTVDNVRAIAGYVDSADGETLLFSIIANSVNIPNAAIDSAADKALVRLATFSRQR